MIVNGPDEFKKLCPDRAITESHQLPPGIPQIACSECRAPLRMDQIKAALEGMNVCAYCWDRAYLMPPYEWEFKQTWYRQGPQPEKPADPSDWQVISTPGWEWP